MTICAQFDGREIKDCTRGTACVCKREMTAENVKFREILRMIAYPRRGTAEETYTIFDVAALIQASYSNDDLATPPAAAPTHGEGVK
jgi:hypothetical protein